MWVKRLEHPKGVEYKIKKARRRKKTFPFLAALYYFLGPPTPFAKSNVGIENKIFKNTLLSHFGRALFVLCEGFHGQQEQPALRNSLVTTLVSQQVQDPPSGPLNPPLLCFTRSTDKTCATAASSHNLALHC